MKKVKYMSTSMDIATARQALQMIDDGGLADKTQLCPGSDRYPDGARVYAEGDLPIIRDLLMASGAYHFQWEEWTTPVPPVLDNPLTLEGD